MTNASTVSREAVAAEVRAWMGRRRISQTALAKHLGTSQAAISRRLSGEVPFDLDELFAMADYFDIAPSDLLKPSGGSRLSPCLDDVAAQRARRAVDARARQLPTDELRIPA